MIKNKKIYDNVNQYFDDFRIRTEIHEPIKRIDKIDYDNIDRNSKFAMKDNNLVFNVENKTYKIEAKEV